MSLKKTVISWLTALTLAVSPALKADDLLKVYQLALESDPGLKAVEANTLAIKETHSQSKARLYPQLNASANTAQNRQEIVSSSSSLFPPQTYNYKTSGYALDLSFPLYHHDYYAHLHQTDALTAQAEAQYRAAQQALIVQVAGRYFDVLAAGDNLEFAKAEKNAIQRQLEQTRRRFEVGLIAITDVNEAQAGYDAAVAQEITAENQQASAREGLRELTGQMHDQLLGPREDIPLITPEPQDIEKWIQTALDRNFDLLAAESGVRAAQQGVDQSRAGHYPSLDLVGHHDYTNIGGGSFGSRDTRDTSLGLQLNIPLYQGGGVSSRVREANYRLDQARDNHELQRRTVTRQTRDAYLNVQSAISRVQALKQAVISSESALKAVEAGNEVGTRTIVDVLQAQREMYRARRDYARERYDYILNTLRLKQAAGMLAVSDVETINGWLK